jgi:hypothetical protein
MARYGVGFEGKWQGEFDDVEDALDWGQDGCRRHGVVNIPPGRQSARYWADRVAGDVEIVRRQMEAQKVSGWVE